MTPTVPNNQHLLLCRPTNHRQREVMRKLANLCASAERGEDTSFEFVTAMVPIVIMILLIAFVVIVRGSQMPAWSAASDCARAAVATLDESIGRQQAMLAARQSLIGNSISAMDSFITINGSWNPGDKVTCQVAYDVDVSWIEFLNVVTKGKVLIYASATMTVEPYKSNWN
ncbi:MAG TPA: hypothetical protein VGK81_10660 [Anaerolineae bacterium]